MKIAITGALGHIGSKLIRELPVQINDPDILMIDNLTTQRYSSIFNLPKGANYRFEEKDIMDTELTGLLADTDYVIHLAAITNAEGSFKIKEQVEQINYEGTIKVADASMNINAKMIYLSTTSVYGTQSEEIDEACAKEDLKPQSPYAESKLKGEYYLKELGESKGINFVIFRFGTICGTSPGMSFHTAINKFCWQAVNEEPLTIWRTALNQRRPYLALDDAIRAIIFAIKKDIFNKKIYNVVTDNMTVQQIIDIIEQQIPELHIEFVDTEIMNQLSFSVLNDRIKKEGFEFKGSISNNIGETLDLLSVNNRKL